MRTAVMGAGSWGSVFAMILADAGCDVSVWARSQEIVDEINSSHTNSQYCDDMALPVSINASTNAAEVLADVDRGEAGRAQRRIERARVNLRAVDVRDLVRAIDHERDVMPLAARHGRQYSSRAHARAVLHEHG